jgi:regulatory protein
MRQPLSLKGRALSFLSRREHSRKELTQKLRTHAESVEQLEAVLDEMEKLNFLSNDRFIESVVRRKGEKFGVMKLKQELTGHGLDVDKVKDALAGAKVTEYDRAKDVWKRKFSQPAADMSERAKQMRFLGARGFSGDVVRRVLSDSSQFDDDLQDFLDE